MTWLDELRKQVASSSMSEVAQTLGISKATVSLVLNGKYQASTDAIQKKVESIYLGHTVMCPILGEIPKHKCAAQQVTKHVGSSPQAIRLYKACRSGCPHSELEERLNNPVRISVQERAPTAITKRKEVQTQTRPYDAQTAINRLERQARTDSAEKMGGSYQRIYIELLQREIKALGARYNRAIKQP